MVRTIILFGFALGLLSSQAQAAIYYVDSGSGNDFHAGTVVSNPWKTLQYASSGLYHPGDQILLKAGTVWRGETLNISTTDESEDPITISSYGPGNQPVLNGANSSSPPITLNNARNVVISNLTIQNAPILIYISGGSNNTVRNCTLINADSWGTFMKDSTNFTFSNNTYTTTGTFRMHGKVFGAVASVNGIKVTGNKITLNSYNNAVIGIYIFDVDNAEVSGNIITGGTEPIGIKGVHRSVTGTKIHDNQLYNYVTGQGSGFVGDGEGIEFTGWKNTPYTVSGSIYHNFVKGGPHSLNGIAVYQSPYVAVYNNIVIGPLLNAAIHFSTTSPKGLFYGNTIHNVEVAFGVFSGSSATIRNNIVSKAGMSFKVGDNVPISEDYNIFYESGPIPSTVTRGGHSTTADPKFVTANPAGPMDVKLQSGSPAIHSGTSLSSAYSLALDPASTSWPCALLNQAIYGWDRGAFGHK